MPPKKHIIIIGVLCVISLGLGYWYGMPKEGSSGGGGGNGDPKEPEFLKQGLVAYYPFNGNAKDESGNSHHGDVKGATLSADRHEAALSAYSFDGVDDYLTFDINSSFPFGENAFGMAVWIKIANTLPTWRAILATDTYNTKGRNGISLYQNGKELSFWVGGFNSTKNICHASDLFGTATWTHVIVTSNKGSVNLFVDGVRKAAGTVPRTLDGNLLYWGKNISNFFYYGQLDDIRIYNRALSEAEVKELYEFEKPKAQQVSTRQLTPEEKKVVGVYTRKDRSGVTYKRVFLDNKVLELYTDDKKLEEDGKWGVVDGELHFDGLMPWNIGKSHVARINNDGFTFIATIKNGERIQKQTITAEDTYKKIK